MDEAVKGVLDCQMMKVLLLMMMMVVLMLIMKKLSKARLTDGCWSPTKISLFFTTRTDGFVEVDQTVWASRKFSFFRFSLYKVL